MLYGRRQRNKVYKNRERSDIMRLDKFLKVSRIIKRRTLAKEVADQGRILINGTAAKASSIVKVGDELTIRFGQKVVTVQVDDLQETTKKEDASNLYTVIKEEKVEQ
jgi:ribosomal 50S subunit-recycling heat shock protein